MSFVTEKMTQKELLGKYPEKYSVLKKYFITQESLGFYFTRWIADHDREIYVLLLKCGEIREADVYVILFCDGDHLVVKVEDNSFFGAAGGKANALVIHVSDEIKGKIALVQSLINEAFNEGEWFGPGNSGAIDTPQLFIAVDSKDSHSKKQ